MKEYQFTVCVILDDGFVMPLANLVTPVVQETSFGAAVNSMQVKDFCERNKCRVFRQVGGG